MFVLEVFSVLLSTIGIILTIAVIAVAVLVACGVVFVLYVALKPSPPETYPTGYDSYTSALFGTKSNPPSVTKAASRREEVIVHRVGQRELD